MIPVANTTRKEWSLFGGNWPSGHVVGVSEAAVIRWLLLSLLNGIRANYTPPLQRLLQVVTIARVTCDAYYVGQCSSGPEDELEGEEEDNNNNNSIISSITLHALYKRGLSKLNVNNNDKGAKSLCCAFAPHSNSPLRHFTAALLEDTLQPEVATKPPKMRLSGASEASEPRLLASTCV